jgi:hypothetical protein
MALSHGRRGPSACPGSAVTVSIELSTAADAVAADLIGPDIAVS